MSSPVVFSLTAAQCRALRCLAEGKASDTKDRPLRQLVIKGLVSDCTGWSLTPAGEAAALMVGRLTEASPVTGGSGSDVSGVQASKASHVPALGIHAVSAATGGASAEGAGRSPLGLKVKSSRRSTNNQKEIKARSRPILSRLAQQLMMRGGILPESCRELDVIDQLTPGEWDLVVAHDAQGDVLAQAERAGRAGVRSLLAELRARPPAE